MTRFKGGAKGFILSLLSKRRSLVGMGPQKRVTLLDIAKVAGCSRVAVSLALRGSSEVSAATRERIQELARKMGYVPDPDLAGLVAYRMGNKAPDYRATIAALFSSGVKQFEQRNLTPGYDYLIGARARAGQLGYRIEEFLVGDGGLSVPRFCSMARARNIRGILIMPLSEPSGLVELPWQDFSVIAFGFTVTLPTLHRVTSSHYRSMGKTLKKLRELGYRRIGLATQGGIDDRVGNAFLAAYLVEHYRWSREPAIAPYMPETAADWSAREFREWIKSNAVEAIISSNRDFIGRLEDVGLKAPRDVGYAGLSVASESGPESGIFEDAFRIGTVAVEQLVGHLQRNEYGLPESPHTLLVEGKWVAGATVRRPGIAP